jgi:hypothetical protein
MRCGLLWVGLALSAAGHTAAAAEIATAKDCHFSQYESLDFTIAHGSVLVPVSLEGHQAFMILSTRSTYSALWVPVATAEYSLQSHPIPAGAELFCATQRADNR